MRYHLIDSSQYKHRKDLCDAIATHVNRYKHRKGLCDAIATHVNRYMLSPNTTEYPCENQARFKRGKRNLCGVHLLQYEREEAKTRYRLRMKEQRQKLKGGKR